MSPLRMGVAMGVLAGMVVVVYRSVSSGVAESADTTRLHGLSTTLDPAPDSTIVPVAHRDGKGVRQSAEEGVPALQVCGMP